MTPRERVLACLEGESPDQVPMRDSALPLAVARWEREGMPRGGFPACFFENCLDGMGFDDTLRLPVEVVETDGRTRTVRNGNGVTSVTLPGEDSTDHPIDFLIKTRRDWEANKEHSCRQDNKAS